MKMKDKKRNRRLEAGRDLEMDDRHMEDIKKGLCVVVEENAR